MHPAIENLKARWLRERATMRLLRGGASAQAIAAFEARYNVVFPPEMRELYVCADGMNDLGMDDSLMCLHPLDEVVPVRDYDLGWAEGPSWTDLWFVFANFLINSHLYLIRLSSTPGDGNPVAMWSGSDERHAVARSFAEFLEIYARRDNFAGLPGTGELFPGETPTSIAPHTEPIDC